MSTTPGSGPPACAICKKRFRPTDKKATAKTGSIVHDRCLARAQKAGGGGKAAGRRQSPTLARKAPPAPARPSGVTAERAGTCPGCGRGYPAGSPIKKDPDGGWGHADCVPATTEFARNKARIEAGETYRSQKPSDWRRGRGPSSHRSTR